MRIAIIGAGVVGVSSAYALSQQGHEITVFDEHASSAEGCSFANAGLLTPSLCDPWNSPGVFWQLFKNLGSASQPLSIQPSQLLSFLSFGFHFTRFSSKKHFEHAFEQNIKLAKRSLVILDAIQAHTPFPFAHQARGCLQIVRKNQDKGLLNHLDTLAKKMKLACEPLSISSLLNLAPELAYIEQDLQGALYYPDEHSGDARLFTEGLAAYLQTQGVKFNFSSPVLLHQCKKNGVVLQQEGSSLAFDSIVVTAGSASTSLLQPLGIRLNMAPVKGYSLTFECSSTQTFPQYPVIDIARHAVVTPIGNRLRVTGVAAFEGNNKTISKKSIDYLQCQLFSTYPQAKAWLNTSQPKPWCGLRPTSADGMPYISSTIYPNLFINTGHGHSGWTQALASGEHLAKLIKNPSTPNPFSLKRS